MFLQKKGWTAKGRQHSPVKGHLVTKKRVLLISGFLLVTLWSVEFLMGFPRFIDGSWVYRKTIWNAIGMGLPIPYQRGEVYYFYHDPLGNEIRHGYFRQLHGNGEVNNIGQYRHGRFFGIWNNFNHKGQQKNKTIYRDGEQVGWATYMSGSVSYYNEKIYWEEDMIAWKRFENGRWFLSTPTGVKHHLKINSTTGEIYE